MIALIFKEKIHSLKKLAPSPHIFCCHPRQLQEPFFSFCGLLSPRAALSLLLLLCLWLSVSKVNYLKFLQSLAKSSMIFHSLPFSKNWTVFLESNIVQYARPSFSLVFQRKCRQNDRIRFFEIRTQWLGICQKFNQHTPMFIRNSEEFKKPVMQETIHKHFSTLFLMTAQCGNHEFICCL